MKQLLTLFLLLFFSALSGQNEAYWQQHVDYKMYVDVDVKKYRYKGTQQLTYTNNSPDTLQKVFYHLYFNAFQPGSEMDGRLHTVADPDSRMVTNRGTGDNPRYESKIALLRLNEIGYLKVISLKQNGLNIKHETEGTVLEVTLNKPIKPGETAVFEMVFEGQVPNLIRRAGRNSEDGVALSMAQWYPKMAEYDYEGWHTSPYIGREFHGVWGNFDVKLHIDKNYTVGGTGYLQNPQEVGHGYEDINKPLKLKNGNKLTWHFIAPNVHDFTWAADPQFIHDVVQTKSGTTLHFLYKNKTQYLSSWKELQPYAEKALEYFNQHIGPYPYKQYSIIQGGDGGMEYAMCTLISGGSTLKSILSTMYHELAHSWFQQILATNESKYSWMDEGFTSYISSKALQEGLGLDNSKPNLGKYEGYFYVVKNGLEEPLTTHADRFNTNTAFSVASYSKGSIFLTQLNYIIGEENVEKSLKKYYNTYKFKHPTPNNFIRIAEKISGIHLGWYLNEWTETTHIIDYAVASINNIKVTLARVGEIPMPIDLTVTYFDNTSENFYIPLTLMRGEKKTAATLLKDWSWGHSMYSFSTDKPVKKVEIDPLGYMADVDKTNNVLENIKP